MGGGSSSLQAEEPDFRPSWLIDAQPNLASFANFLGNNAQVKETVWYLLLTKEPRPIHGAISNEIWKLALTEFAQFFTSDDCMRAEGEVPNFDFGLVALRTLAWHGAPLLNIVIKDSYRRCRNRRILHYLVVYADVLMLNINAIIPLTAFTSATTWPLRFFRYNASDLTLHALFTRCEKKILEWGNHALMNIMLRMQGPVSILFQIARDSYGEKFDLVEAKNHSQDLISANNFDKDVSRAIAEIRKMRIANRRQIEALLSSIDAEKTFIPAVNCLVSSYVSWMPSYDDYENGLFTYIVSNKRNGKRTRS